MEVKEDKIQSIRFPMDLYIKLKYMADSNFRALNGEVLTAVKKYVAEYERENGEIVVENAYSNQ